MKICPRLTLPKNQGFTLVEVMVTMVLVIALLYFLITTVSQTQAVMTRTTEKVAQFQSARSGFEAMTRRLSQATLNTYWRAHDNDITTATTAFKFRRQSELHFISGPTKRFFSASPQLSNLAPSVEKAYPTHAVFFQAPMGYSEETTQVGTVRLPTFRNLDSLLSGCGYFVEYGPETERPPFLTSVKPTLPDRFRFRLMEMALPSEKLTIFQRPIDEMGYVDPRVFDEKNSYYAGMVKTEGQSARPSNTSWVRPLWMKEAFLRTTTTPHRFQYARVRAENIIALVILPKLAEKDRVVPGTTTADPKQLELAPAYEFDSWRILNGKTAVEGGRSVDNTARDNLLPPIIQVTMVAVDEKAMARFGPTATRIPTWTEGLFTKAKLVSDYTTDIQTLEQRLIDDPYKPNYRIFTADIVLRGSKWSRDP